MNANLYLPRKADYALYEVALAKATDQQLIEISSEFALGLNLQEMKSIQAYFKEEGKNPSDLELQTISQTWSEHCCHKTLKEKSKSTGRKLTAFSKPT